MASVDIRALIGRLNGTCRSALERAAQRAVSAGNFQVEVEHLLEQLIDTRGSDADEILGAYDVDRAELRTELARALAAFKSGAGRTPAFSPHIHPLLADAWMVASLDLGLGRIRSAALMLALIEADELRDAILTTLPSLRRLSRDRLRRDLSDLCKAARLEHDGPAPAAAPETQAATPALDAYSIDLTAEARAGRIDPIIGREAEIRQVIDILLRRRQNNPILTGEAGVGKTAVVEGLALRIAAGQVPPAMAEVSLRSLDLGLLQAGAGMRGELERRLKQVIDEVRSALVPVILFIDEAHTLIGAGGEAGMGDAANLLKPALARGELRTIAATTWAEYKRHVEKDAALARRFQVVKVEEPEPEAAIPMVRGLVRGLERHHGIRILDEAVRDAVRLSARYLPDRRLPDKAVSVLDTACARAVLARSAPPPDIEDLERDLAALGDELALLAREVEAGDDRIDALERDRTRLEERHIALSARWRREAELVEDLAELRADPASWRDAIAQIETELAALRDGQVLVSEAVDGAVVASVVAAWTGIPVGKMMTDEIAALLRLKDRLAERIVGQDQALDMIARRIRTASADLAEPGKPPGIFLLVGPSGVGKTETACALADLLYGGEAKMITVNMSEYQEAHSVSNLKGAPPGYVGYGKGGILTEAVRRRPHAVLLLDEIEKAHPDVLEMFYQVFDKGVLEDSDGQMVSFKNVLILLTSNLGAEALTRLAEQGISDGDALARAVRPHLLTRLAPAFLGRMVAVPYLPLDSDRIAQIVRLKLARLQDRFQDSYGAELTYAAELVAGLAGRSVETDSGARAVDHILTGSVLPALSEAVLQRLAEGTPFTTAHLVLEPDGRVAPRLR